VRVFAVSGEVGQPALLFLGGIGTGGLGAGMGKQTGGAEIGVLLEGEVNLWFELGEGGGVASELLSPAFLLLGQRGLDVLKRLLQRRNLRTGFATQAKLHGRPLARSRLLNTLLSY
jgi:hypothetical protein